MHRKLEKARAIRAEVEELREHLELMNVTVSLSTHPLWKTFAKEMEKLMAKKVDLILTLGGREYTMDEVDRKKAELCAEVRLMKNILLAPDKNAEDAPKIRDDIDEMEKEIVELERLYKFTKGA